MTGYVTMLARAAVSWAAKKQVAVTLSTTEAECMASCEAVRETIRITSSFREVDLTDFVSKPSIIFMESKCY